MKNKLALILIVVSCLFLGCQSTQPTLYTQADNGDLIKVTVNKKVDKATEQAILDYIKNDADKHYASSNDPYKFTSRNR